MGKNRDFQTVFLSKLMWTLQKSEWQYKLTKISDRLQELARTSANILAKSLEQRESMLQEIDANFDMDDLSTDELKEVMNARKEAEEAINAEQQMQMARVNVAEKFEQQQQQMVEVSLENANAQIETLDQYLGTVDCGYFDSSAA